MAKTKPKGLRKKELSDYLKLVENRKAIDRVSRVLEKQEEAEKARFRAAVIERGGEAKQIIEGGHRLTLHTEDGLVKWKAEFIRVAGAAAAANLENSAEKREKLLIEPLEAPTSKKAA